MTHYKLFLTKDTRTDISYNHFIGRTWKLHLTSMIKKVKLWDVLAQAYYKEEVVLKVVKIHEDIIEVEVADGIL